MINPDTSKQQSQQPRFDLSPKMNGTSNCVDRGGGTLNSSHSAVSVDAVMQVNGVVEGEMAAAVTAAAAAAAGNSSQQMLERDYYGCYCLKFIVKNGTHTTEEKVLEDFGAFGDVVDVRGPGLFSGLRGNHVYVRFIDRADAEEALRNLSVKYHQLTPASISDVLPDNYGLYTISFYNKTGIPSAEVRREFSKFGEVKNLTGSLDVKGGRVFVSYKEKGSAVAALQAFFFRKDRYPNMKFALPRCEKDYFGCYCLKFYNKSGDVTEAKVMSDFGQFGDVVDVRGPGLFDVTGDDVYVRYKEKSSAEQALIELVGKYDSLCLAPPSDIQADKFGYFTITFVNDKCLSKSDVWYIFSKFGTVACVNGTFDCKKGRVFVSYKEKQGALNALETMLITKEYHLQVSKNSTVRKNDYNVAVPPPGIKDEPESFNDIPSSTNPAASTPTGPAGNKRPQQLAGFANGSPAGQPLPPPPQQPPPQHKSTSPLVPPPVPMAGQLSALSGHNGPRVPSTMDDLHLLQRVQQQQRQHNQQHLQQHTRSRSREIIPPVQAPVQQQLMQKQPNLPNSGSPSFHHPPPPVMAPPPPPMGHPGHGPGMNSQHGGPESSPPPPLPRHMNNSPGSGNMKQQQPPPPPNVMNGINPADVSMLTNGAAMAAAAQAAAAAVAAAAAAAAAAGSAQPPPPINNRSNGIVRFNRNVEKDIFGYFCLSFLNEDGDISEKKVRHDFGKFGEVVSVRGALGKQKGHVFVRFRRKEAAENCLNCLNSFPLSEMSELFGKYLFLSPATPRDIDCDTFGLYSISFLNLNLIPLRDVRQEFSKFGEIVRMTPATASPAVAAAAAANGQPTSGTEELVTVSFSEKQAAIKALRAHFTNKEFPYLDIAKGSSLLLVNSSDSSDTEDYELNGHHMNAVHHLRQQPPPHPHGHNNRPAPIGTLPPPALNAAPGAPVHHPQVNREHPGLRNDDPFHDPTANGQLAGHSGIIGGSSSDVVDELLKPFQSYFSIYRTGQYHSGHGLGQDNGPNVGPSINNHAPNENNYGLGTTVAGNGHHHQRSPEKKYRIKSVKQTPPPPNNAGGNPPCAPPPPHPPSPAAAQAAQSPAIKPQLIASSAEKRPLTMKAVNGCPEMPLKPLCAVQQQSPENPMFDIVQSNMVQSNDLAAVAQQHQHQQQHMEQNEAPATITPNPVVLAATPEPKKFEKEGTPSSVASTTTAASSMTAGTTEDEEMAAALAEKLDIQPEPAFRAVDRDVFGLYSVTFVSRSKDLSDRKLRLDFEKFGDVARVRGQFGPGESVIVSYTEKECAETVCRDAVTLSKYPTLAPAPQVDIVPDKDGHWSIEFSNSRMSSIREITQDFSKHGEVVKVMFGSGSGAAKSNGVKRVTVSYADRQSAFDAVNSAHDRRKNKDFQNVDFAKECVLEVVQPSLAATPLDR